MRYALEQLGEALPSDDRLARCIGPPLHSSFGDLLQTSDKKRIGLAVEKYRERYREQGILENSVYPGIPEALGQLSLYGARLLVATSKPRVFADRIIQHFDLGENLDSVWGSELDGTRSDKGLLIKHIIMRTKIDPGSSMMIGDREHDAIGARANGLLAAGALWGYGSREELTGAGCAVLLQCPSEMVGLLSRQ
jgi:phosphoglycolate phosphatase